MLEFFKLPYAMNALEPFLSQETIEYHYLKHHKTYFDNLVRFIQDDVNLQNLSLEQIILQAQGAVFNNAAQVWNHDFYWKCLQPYSKDTHLPSASVLTLFIEQFGSFENFKEQFTQYALKTFGSGWAWLVIDKNHKLSIISTSNALTPISTDLYPLLTCDVWEHAYYIDYRNKRAAYLDAFWACINWNFVAQQLQSFQNTQ